MTECSALTLRHVLSPGDTEALATLSRNWKDVARGRLPRLRPGAAVRIKGVDLQR